MSYGSGISIFDDLFKHKDILVAKLIWSTIEKHIFGKDFTLVFNEDVTVYFLLEKTMQMMS